MKKLCYTIFKSDWGDGNMQIAVIAMYTAVDNNVAFKHEALVTRTAADHIEATLEGQRYDTKNSYITGRVYTTDITKSTVLNAEQFAREQYQTALADGAQLVVILYSDNSKQKGFKIVASSDNSDSYKLATSIRKRFTIDVKDDYPLVADAMSTSSIYGNGKVPTVKINIGNAFLLADSYARSQKLPELGESRDYSSETEKYLKDIATKAATIIANGILDFCKDPDVNIQPTLTDASSGSLHVTEPSYTFITDPVEIVDYDIPTADRPSVQASISAAAETALMNIHDKQLTLTCDYLIYFDDVLMNDFILSYSCSLGVDIGIGRASVALIYAPQFNKISINDSVNDGIENGTQLRIFMRNVFAETYIMCFEGIIKQKVLARDASGFTLSFVAVDYVYWMNKIIAPISIPINEAISPGERLKWKAQSVDPDLTAKVEIAQAGSLKGKTLTEYFDTLKEKSFTNSKVYSESNSVANWDDVVNRVEIMGDINELLVRDQVIDFVVNSNSVFADTVYVSLSNTTQGLLMEMYQDRDGIVRIKPPFWNEAVLKNHIIDPMMIISAQESTDWNKYYTRIIVTGGVEEWMDSGTTAQKVDLLTPVGVYLGSLTDKSAAKWADYTSEGSYPSSYNTTGIGGSDTSTSGGVSGISNQSVIDYLNTMRTPQEWGIGTGTQCVELPKHYVEKCFGVSTKANGYGHGKDLYSGIASAFPDLFEAIPWSSGVQPRSGDIMSTSSPSQPAYGHALIVKSVSGSSIGLLDQWSGIEKVRDKVWTLSGDTITLGSEVRTIYGLARPKNI